MHLGVLEKNMILFASTETPCHLNSKQFYKETNIMLTSKKIGFQKYYLNVIVNRFLINNDSVVKSDVLE